jgi:hypothetical protein
MSDLENTISLFMETIDLPELTVRGIRLLAELDNKSNSPALDKKTQPVTKTSECSERDVEKKSYAEADCSKIENEVSYCG